LVSANEELLLQCAALSKLCIHGEVVVGVAAILYHVVEHNTILTITTTTTIISSSK